MGLAQKGKDALIKHIGSYETHRQLLIGKPKTRKTRHRKYYPCMGR